MIVSAGGVNGSPRAGTREPGARHGRWHGRHASLKTTGACVTFASKVCFARAISWHRTIESKLPFVEKPRDATGIDEKRGWCDVAIRCDNIVRRRRGDVSDPPVPIPPVKMKTDGENEKELARP